MPYFKFGGSRLHYSVVGKGHPVLMIHGMLESSKNTLRFARSLTKMGFQCILVDLPLHGKTRGIMLSIDGIVASLKALMTHLGAKEYQCFGFSLGAAICSIIIRRDQRVKSMAVVSPVLSDFRPFERVFFILLKSLFKFRLKYSHIIRELASDLVAPNAPDKMVERVISDSHEARPLSLFTDALMAAQINTGLNLLYTEKPIMVVSGKYDILSPPYLVKNSLSDLAKFVVIKKGHSDILASDLVKGKKYLLGEFFKSTL